MFIFTEKKWSNFSLQYGNYQLDEEKDDIIEDGFIGSDPEFCIVVNCNALGAPKSCPTKCGKHGEKK